MKVSQFTFVYLWFVIFIPSSIAIVNIPGFPLISFGRAYLLCLSIIYIALCFLRVRVRTAVTMYPFHKPMLIVLASMLTVTLFADNLTPSINVMLAFLIESYFLSMIIWVSFRRESEIISVMGKIVFVMVLLAIYGSFAFLSGTNPILEYISFNYTNESRRLIFLYQESERLGLYGRAQSVFAHPIQYGVYLVFSASLSLYLLLRCRSHLSIKYIIFILISIAALFSTLSRSPLLMLLVAMLAFWFYQNPSKKIALIGVAMGLSIFAMLFQGQLIWEILRSIIVDLFGGDSGMGGSTIGMRIEQLRASYLLFIESPIVGHGLAATRLMSENGTLPPLIRRGESFLFTEMIDAGIVGVLAFVYFYYFILRYFLRSKRSLLVDSRNLSHIIISLTLGYILYILSTGDILTFQLYLVLFTLSARYIDLCGFRDSSSL